MFRYSLVLSLVISISAINGPGYGLGNNDIITLHHVEIEEITTRLQILVPEFKNKIRRFQNALCRSLFTTRLGSKAELAF